MFKWVHVSDIHFQTKKENTAVNTDLLREKLVTTLQTISDVDALFITGDFRYGPEKEKNVKVVTAYIERLINALKITKNQVYIVPGNHDLDRGDMRLSLLEGAKKRYNSNEGMFDSKSLTSLLGDFSFFNDLEQQLYGENKLGNNQNIHELIELEYCNLLLLNTSILAGTNTDDNSLLLGTKYINNTLSKLKNDKPTFALGHHGLDFLNKPEKRNIVTMLESKEIFVYLCGHSHALWNENYGKQSKQVTVGCLLQKDNSVDAGFNIGILEDDNHTAIEAYHWDIPHSTWIEYSLESGDINFYQKKTDELPRTLDEPPKEGNLLETNWITKPNISPISTAIPRTELQEIINKINSSCKIAITGMGGIGKTEILREIAKQISANYDYVGWIDYTGNLASDLMSQVICYAQNPNLNFEENLNLLHKKLFQIGKKLLLFVDNVDTNQDKFLMNTLTRLEGTIILSTRMKDFSTSYSNHELGFLNEEQCKELFYTHYTKGKDDNIVNGIIKRANCHTLTVEIIAKTAAKKQYTLQDISEELAEKGFDLTGIAQTSWNDDQAESLMTQLNKLYQFSAIETDAIQVEILQKFAFLPQISISGKEIETILGITEWEKLAVLVSKGWIEQSIEGFSMHNIIREIIKANCILSISLGCKIGNNLQTMLNDQKNDTNRLLQQQLFIYVSSLCETYQEMLTSHKMDTKSQVLIANAFGELAGCYQRQGLYKQSLGWHDKALAIVEEQLGKNHLDTAATYNNIALVYQDLGKPETALDYCKKALAIVEEQLGENHLDTAATYNNIALVYQDLGKPETALDYYKKALAIKEEQLGENHLDTATAYHNMAGVYQALGEYETALDYYKKALTIREEQLGENHLDTATTYNNIALVYQDLGEYETALGYHKKALAIREEQLGENHPDTATTYHNMAGVYQDLGESETALDYYKKALAIREEQLGENHPTTATTYNNMAGVYQALGQPKTALDYYKKALTIREEQLEENHSTTAITYNNIAGVYQDLGQYETALDYYKKALAIVEEQLGENHLDTATIYNNMAGVYQAIGQPETALDYYKKALAIVEEQLGENHPNLVNEYVNIAELSKETGDFTQAYNYYSKAENILKKLKVSNKDATMKAIRIQMARCKSKNTLR